MAKLPLPLPDAVIVAVCDEVTAVAVAVKPALVDPSGTITLAGTVTALLSLARLMFTPPVGAAEARLAVQESVPAPLIEAWLHEIDVSAGAAATNPVPLRFATRLPCWELLAIVRAPVAAPACCGLNCTLSLTVCPLFSVSGKLAPDTEKPAPETVAAVTSVAFFPVDVSVTDCDAVEFIATPPNEMVVELKLSVREPEALSFNAKVAVALPAVAVRVAV